jgi:hypothetical protein
MAKTPKTTDTAPGAAAVAETVQVTILSPVDHDGQRHDIGASLELPASQAEALIKAGAAEASGGAEAAPV